MAKFDKIRSDFLNSLWKKDITTYWHSLNVGRYAYQFAEYLGFSFSERKIAQLAGELHDIGKLFVPSSILTKNGRLTDEEFDVIKKHPLLGFEEFSRRCGSGLLYEQIGEVILCHHERYDGTGYPNGVPIGDCSDIVSIVALCDVYDAITAKRPHQSAQPPEKALQIMIEKRGVQFRPDLLDKFVRLFGVHHSILLSRK